VADSFIVGKKIASDKKWGGSEAGKPWTLKSGGLDPRSLTEVYAYAYERATGLTILRSTIGGCQTNVEWC